MEERIAELEDEKKQAIPHAVQLEKQQQEIDHFLEWVEEMKGRYHEATYEEKRVALRVLGITVLLYKESDREHLRYEIRVGLTQLFSDLARDWESHR